MKAEKNSRNDDFNEMHEVCSESLRHKIQKHPLIFFVSFLI